MDLHVIVPSAEYLAQAGVRIRYRRMEPYLAALGHKMVIEVIDDMASPDKVGGDMYLFSKCYDAAAVLIARGLRNRGKLVGIDFFDDMFSETEDSRFIRHRAWVKDMQANVDFALCSTPRLSTVLGELLPGCPVHIMNDPFGAFDAARLARRAEEKRLETLRSGVIKAAWFGVGDNPHFDIGLFDLSSFASELQELERTGMTVDLRILTNPRALTVDGLRMIGRLPVRHRVDEWTEQREADLLDDCLLSFLPVNGQKFSIAKSLNRAVSALSGGTQVFSTGFPLYEPLSDFVYRDGAILLTDLAAGSLRVRDETMDALRESLKHCGDPEVEAEGFSDFMRGLVPRSFRAAQFSAVLHGRKSPARVKKITRRLGSLLVATPFSSPKLNYDIRLKALDDPTRMDVELSARAATFLADSFKDAARPSSANDKGVIVTVTVDAIVSNRFASVSPEDLAQSSSDYGPVIGDIGAIVHRLLPDIHILLSETEAPFDARLPGDSEVAQAPSPPPAVARSAPRPRPGTKPKPAPRSKVRA